MPLVLYYFPPSPPCRSVMLLAKALDVPLSLETVNILQQEHLKESFIKINPQHVIPTLDDNGFIIWESRAILTYLANRYAKDDLIYPKDAKKRAVVDQRLYFDAGTLHPRVADYLMPVVLKGEAPDPSKLEKIHEALGYLELFLKDQDWVAGDDITIADIAIVVTVSNAEAIGVDLEAYENISRWYSTMKTQLEGYEEINQVGADLLGEMFHSKIS